MTGADKMIRLSCAILALLCLTAGAPIWAQSTPQGVEFPINTATAGHQRAPAVAADAQGNFVVVWEDSGADGSGFGITGAVYDSSGVLQLGPFPVNTYTTSDQVDPALAMDSVGNFVVAWTSEAQDGDYSGIFGQRFDAAGSPVGAEFAVNTHTTGHQDYSNISLNDDGEFVVVWERDTPSYQDYANVAARRFDATGTAQGDEFIVNAVTQYFQGDPDVAMDGSGGFVVVWESCYQGGEVEDVFARRYDENGTPQSPEFQVNTYTTENQLYPAVSMDDVGNFVVVWQSDTQDGSLFGVVGRRFDSGGTPAGPEFPVNTTTLHFQRFTDVAVDGSGNFVVTWQSTLQDGSGVGVFARRYDATGAPEAGEMQVNTFTTGDQTAAAVATGDSGDFIVAWQDASQDGDLTGVFAQRFACAPSPGAVTGLTVEHGGGGVDVVLSWAATAGAVDYIAFSDAARNGGFTTEEGTVSGGLTTLTFTAPAGDTYFLVTSRNSCGLAPKR